MFVSKSLEKGHSPSECAVSPSPCKYCDNGREGKYVSCEDWINSKGKPVACGEAYREAEQRKREIERFFGLSRKDQWMHNDRYRALSLFQKILYRYKPWDLVTEDEIKEIWGKDYPERKHIKSWSRFGAGYIGYDKDAKLDYHYYARNPVTTIAAIGSFLGDIFLILLTPLIYIILTPPVFIFNVIFDDEWYYKIIRIVVVPGVIIYLIIYLIVRR